MKLVLNKLRSDFAAQKPVCSRCGCSSSGAAWGLGARGTAVHGYTHCSFMQIKPLECSLAIGELETATGVLVNKAGSGQSLTVAAVAMFPGRASIVWGGGAGDRLHRVALW